MTCDQIYPILGALIDRELSPADDFAVQTHLEACKACQAQYVTLVELRAALEKQPRFSASDDLRRRIEAQLPSEPQEGKLRIGWIFVFVLGLGVAALTFMLFGRPRLAGVPIETEIVTSHIRSLMPGHLIDVVSSDRHTVKPWFAGKADIAPPTWDFKNDGFELAGGRMDYIAGRATPVLTYRVRKHWINLFVFPDSLESQIATENRSGFHIVSWSQDGLAFAAVSDADATAVAKFVKLYRKASAEGENH